MFEWNSCWDYGNTWYSEVIEYWSQIGISVAETEVMAAVYYVCVDSMKTFLKFLNTYIKGFFSFSNTFLMTSLSGLFVHLFFFPSAILPSALMCSVPCATSPSLPLHPSAPPLLAVCYSCWSNLENVPNPLSVLLPQRNTKWIRQDYCLPLPPFPPPSHPLHIRCHSFLIISSLVCLYLSQDMSLFIARIKAFFLCRWQIGSNVPSRWQMLLRAQCIMGCKVLVIKLWPLGDKKGKKNKLRSRWWSLPSVSINKAQRRKHRMKMEFSVSHYVSFHFLPSYLIIR